MGKNVTISTLPNIGQNYLPKINTSNIFANSLVYDDGSSVLINTTTASAFKLDVNGSIRATSGTLTGALSGTSATFSGNGLFGGATAFSGGIAGGISVNGSTSSGINFRVADATKGYLYVASTGSVYLESVSGSIVLSPNASPALTIASTGAATFTGNVVISQTTSEPIRLERIIGATVYGKYSLAISGSGTFSIYDAVAAADRFLISSTGAATFSSSVTASGNLNLQGAVTRNINFYDSSNTNINAQIQYDQISSNSGQLFFGTNNAGTFATRMTITNGGNVGIGTSSPDLTLSINGAMNLRNSTRAGAMEIDASGNLWLGTATTAGNIYLETGHSTTGLPSTGTSRLTLNSSGATFSNSITSSYTYNGGGTGMIHLTSGGTEGGSITLEKTSGTAQKYKVGNSGSAFFIYNETAGNQPFTILNNGRVGIGTTSPSGKFDVYTGVGATFRALYYANNQIEVSNYNTTDGYREMLLGGSPITFYTGTAGGGQITEKMRITSGGALQMAATTISNSTNVFGASVNGGYQFFNGNLANGEKFGSLAGTYIQGFYFINWSSASGRGYAIFATVSPAANAGTVLISSGGWATSSATYNAANAISLAFDGSFRGPILSNNTGITTTFYAYVFGGI